MINKNVEADLYTAQGFEALGAGLTSAVMGAWKVDDADGAHGWHGYKAGDQGGAIRTRRDRSKSFWTD